MQVINYWRTASRENRFQFKMGGGVFEIAKVQDGRGLLHLYMQLFNTTHTKNRPIVPAVVGRRSSGSVNSFFLKWRQKFSVLNATWPSQFAVYGVIKILKACVSCHGIDCQFSIWIIFSLLKLSSFFCW